MIKTSRQLKDLIRNLSKEKSADAQVLMRNYMMERFLAAKEHVGLIRKEAEGLRSDESMDPRRAGETIRGLCDRILEEL